MKTTHLILPAALALLALSPARAQELKPIEARALELGGAPGVAYYTVEPGGYRVVVTLLPPEEGSPLRVEALLAPGGSVVLSTPGGFGAEPGTVEISRRDDAVLVRKASAAAN